MIRVWHSSESKHSVVSTFFLITAAENYKSLCSMKVQYLQNCNKSWNACSVLESKVHCFVNVSPYILPIPVFHSRGIDCVRFQLRSYYETSLNVWHYFDRIIDSIKNKIPKKEIMSGLLLDLSDRCSLLSYTKCRYLPRGFGGKV